MKQYKNLELIVVGGGLAGSEAAWQAASMGVNVHLYEMRPQVNTGAHQSKYLAELVCSNSLGSDLPDRAAGILKRELRTLGSLLMHCADETAVPAGGALAVDRELFAQKVTGLVESHPLIKIIREEVVSIPDRPAIIASGPLTSAKLSSAIEHLTGREQIFFFDAIAPVVYVDSINMDTVFRASRYGKNTLEDGGDYLNCPLKRDEYYAFVEALTTAERTPLLDFERELNIGVRAGLHKYFEGCLPIEVIAMRGKDSLAYGPLRPVGLTDPRTGEHSYAVVQLRQDNMARTLYNIVGFQTNLKYAEQERVIRMIPGMEHVQFSRYGQMHRNTFIFSPGLLKQTLQTKSRDDLFFAGQITGVEGYVGNIATGFLAGRNAASLLLGRPLIEMSPWTMIGALTRYITHAEARDFQPMKANLGILPDLGEGFRGRRMKAAEYAKRSESEIQQYIPLKSQESFA